MRICLQRVNAAQVQVADKVIASIPRGLLLLVGVGPRDDEAVLDHLCRKVLQLRVFPDAEGKMNLSVSEIRGEILAVSQFTLYGDCTRGNRPGFSAAAPPEMARDLFQKFVEKLQASGLPVAAGEFSAQMRVNLENDGPVTLWLEKEPAVPA